MIFDFNSSERRGLLILAFIIALTLGFRILSPLFIKESNTDFSKFKKEIKEFELAQIKLQIEEEKENQAKKDKYNSYKYNNYKTPKYKKKKIKYFELNPNKASISDWKKFGFSDKQSKVIYNYIKKSGGINNKKQLKEIFVINDKKYKEIEPYILIDKKSITKTNKNESYIKYEKIVEINSASKEELMSVKGIGEKISDRIIKYRKILGGFYKKEQLKEVYGITSETFVNIKDYINVDVNNIKQININFSDEKDLYSHPYISYKEAKAIVQYRTKTGFIKDINILIEKNILNNNKAIPYLISQD